MFTLIYLLENTDDGVLFIEAASMSIYCFSKKRLHQSVFPVKFVMC